LLTPNNLNIGRIGFNRSVNSQLEGCFMRRFDRHMVIVSWIDNEFITP